MNGPFDARLVWSVAIVGGSGLLSLVLFGLWMFRHPEPLNERRIRSWSLYGQFLLSTLMVVLICLLMIPRTISAEAGLAVLAAIAGFAAGRSVGPSWGGRRRRARRPADRARPQSAPAVASISPVVASIAPAPPAHELTSSEGAPAPLREVEPIVTARYPRNRGGRP
jgi:hypothetical protein